MVRALPLLLIFAGCEPEPPPTIDEVDWAAAAGTAVVQLDPDGLVTLDGHRIGELREPGVLRQSRHRKLLKALKIRSGQDPTSHDPPEQALLSQGWPVRLELSPGAPWDDVYPLVATAAWAGFGPFELVEQAEPSRAVGPLHTDTRQPAAWAGEPIVGVQPVSTLSLGPGVRCAELRFELRIDAPGDEPLAGLRQLPAVLRSIGSEPLVDCGAQFSEQPELQSACAYGQAPDDSVAEPPASIPAGQRGLPVQPLEGELGARTILAPTKDTPVSELIDVIVAVTAHGAPPVIALTKPTPSDDLECAPVKVRTPTGVSRAGARWLGEHHKPLR